MTGALKADNFPATPQWFASITPIKEDILNAIERVEWVPAWGEVRIANMIKDRDEWCISRQRAWGFQFLFLCGRRYRYPRR